MSFDAFLSDQKPNSHQLFYDYSTRKFVRNQKSIESRGKVKAQWLKQFVKHIISEIYLMIFAQLEIQIIPHIINQESSIKLEQLQHFVFSNKHFHENQLFE